MKKKIFLLVISVLAVAMLAYFPIKKSQENVDLMSGWGKILNDHSQADGTQKSSTNYKLSVKGASSEDIISPKDIYEVGNDILITNQEIEIAKAFYILQGQSEKDAEQTAIKYIEEYNALYVEAVNNGFDVTKNEVDEYISNLKTMVKQVENSYDVKKVIDQFESEDEYWNYEKNVYKKQLPIQKYVKSLEDKYSNHIGDNIDSAENIAKWNNELNKIKKEAVQKQQYKKINSISEIDKKFEVKS